MAVIQFLQDIIITVKENTKIEFESMEKTINGISPIVIKQPLGRMFSKIMKKGSDFQVRTPTTIAGVRGTEFETIVGEKSTTIKLLTGKVTAAPIVDEIAVEEKSVEITENTKIEISHDDVKTPEPITVEEKQNLEAYAKIEPVINIESDETLQNLQSPEPEKNPIVIPEEIKEEVLPPKLTIEKIKKTYGNISKIFLKDGTEYVGAFTQSGAEMVIITTDGTISIKSKDVAKISSFK